MIKKIICSACLVSLYVDAGAYEVDAIYRVQPGYNGVNNDGLFSILEADYFWARNDLMLGYKNNGLVVEWTGVQRLIEGERSEYKGVLNEAYWDTSIDDWEVTIGKKKSLGGRGYFSVP